MWPPVVKNPKELLYSIQPLNAKHSGRSGLPQEFECISKIIYAFMRKSQNG